MNSSAAPVPSLEADPGLAVLLGTGTIRPHPPEVDGRHTSRGGGGAHRAVTTSRVILTEPDLGGSLDWSPNGVFVTEGPENESLVDVRDPATGVAAFVDGHEIDINDVRFSSDGTTRDRRRRRRRMACGPATDVQFSRIPGGTWSSLGSRTTMRDQVRCSARFGFQKRSPRPGHHTVTVVREMGAGLSPVGSGRAEGSQIAVGVDGPPQPSSYRRRNGRPTSTFLDLPNIGRMEWSPDGRHLAIGATVHGSHTPRHRNHSEPSRSLDPPPAIPWAPDSSQLATGSDDGTAKIWEVSDRGIQEVLSLSASATHNGVVGVAFSPDGRHLLVGDEKITAHDNVADVDVSRYAHSASMRIPSSPPRVDFLPDEAFSDRAARDCR